jgi:hypothetical protein
VLVPELSDVPEVLAVPALVGDFGKVSLAGADPSMKWM